MKIFLLLFLLSCPAWPKTLLERVPEAGLQPQAAVDERGVLHLIYMTGDPGASDIWYVRKEPVSKAYSKALRVNSQPQSAMTIGTIRGAKMALGKGGVVHVVWNGSSREKTPFFYSRLDPASGKFEAQRNVITKAFGLDGGGTVAADRNGNVYLSWTSGYQADSEASRKVWVAISKDNGATFAPEKVASGGYGACGCCGMGSATDAQGGLYILYRPANKNAERGMHLLASHDGGSSFSEEKLDDWNLNACPMTNASFSLGPALLGAWERDGKVYVREMGASGQRQAWFPEIQEGSKFPVVAQMQGGFLLAWAEGTGWKKGGSVAWQEFDSGGKPKTARKTAKGLPAWSMPAAVAGPGNDFTIIY